MTPSHIAIAVSILALIGQGLNVYLFLRIRVAILESEQKTERWVDAEFVRTKTCEATHAGALAAREARISQRYP